MKSLLEYKVISSDIEVQYEIFPMYDETDFTDPREQLILDDLSVINERLMINHNRIDSLNTDIERLTNHANGLDYMIAVGSGIIAGIIDSLWVGEFSFERGNSWSDDTVNNFVKNVAKKQGYNGDDLDGAIRYC